jgi:hypothetical protein
MIKVPNLKPPMCAHWHCRGECPLVPLPLTGRLPCRCLPVCTIIIGPGPAPEPAGRALRPVPEVPEVPDAPAGGIMIDRGASGPEAGSLSVPGDPAAPVPLSLTP